MRRRIWSERLPAEELGAPATVALLRRYALEPLVAMPPGSDTPAMFEALAALSRASVPVGLWPLLSDAQGYWPSAVNAAAFCERAREARALAERAGARVSAIAVDLEPPLATVRELIDGSTGRRAALLTGQLRQRRDHEYASRQRRAMRCFSLLRAELSVSGIETVAALVPTVALDVAWNSEFWQQLLQTPVRSLGWSVLTPMFYTSIVSALLPGEGSSLARAAMSELGRALVEAVGVDRAGLSLGLVGSGKLGSEPSYRCPESLAADVRVARAAGVQDLALFSLEGVLHRGEPEAWLEPFTSEQPAPPADLREKLAAMGMRAALRVGRIASS